MTEQLPRPALLAIIGVVAVAGLFFVTRRGGEESTPSSPAPSQTASPSTDAPAQNPAQDSGAGSSADQAEAGQGLPADVAKALDAKKTVVILFWNKKGVDDRSVKGSVDRLSKRGGKVAKFTEPVKNLSNYTRITSAASVTTTPSLVVVNSRGQAEVLAGYNDFQTINQFVANASRRK